MNNVTFAFSISKTIDNILAQSALEHFDNPASERLLTADCSDALRQLVEPSLAALALEIGAEATPSTHGNDIVELRVTLPENADPTAFLSIAQRAVAAMVCAAFLARNSPQAALRHDALAYTSLACLKACKGCKPYIAPARY